MITLDAPPRPRVSRTDLTDRALSDPHLSPSALALLFLLVRLGRPISADDVWSHHLVPGGREAIRSRMRELKTAKYVVVARHKDAKRGGWFTAQDFADVAPEVAEPVDLAKHVHRPLTPSRPGVLSSSPSSTTTVTGKGKDPLSEDPTSDQTCVIRSGWQEARDALESRYRRPTAPQGRAPRNPHTGPGTVPWKGARTMRREPDAGLGGDIDVSDPFATPAEPRGRVKPQRTGRTTDTRSSRTESDWNAFDLTAEFNSRAYETRAGDVPHQINSRDLGGALGRLIRNGSDPAVLAACIRLFFADPRNLHEMGTGAPLWKRFLADVTQTYGKAQRILSLANDETYARPEPAAAPAPAKTPGGMARVRPTTAETTRQQPQAPATATTPATEPWLVTQARSEALKAAAARQVAARALADQEGAEEMELAIFEEEL